MEYGHASEEFVRELHRALQYLYDPTELRKSPLLALFAVDMQRHPLSTLGKILTDAIQALKPADNVPLSSNAWRVYHVLTYRYVERTRQKQVAIDLGFSIRQLRRQENEAVHVLADYLWGHYNLETQARHLAATPSQAWTEEQGTLPNASTPGREQELEWLRESFPSETADVAGVIGAAFRDIAPLMQAAGVQVECRIAEDRPPVTGQLATLRQALLNLLTAAVQSVPGGRVQVAVETDAAGIHVHVQAIDGEASSWATNGEIMEHLQMTRQLIDLFGGELDLVPVQSGAQPFAATLVLSAAEQVPVLVIDDNADTLRLLQRYLAGTRYRFTGARDPEQALLLAEESAPHVIVMDVMLPGIDGWELLGRLREHPHMRAVPIIVCTILPQERMALALGAAAFIRKPVSRETLLATLDQQLDLQAKESY